MAERTDEQVEERGEADVDELLAEVDEITAGADGRNERKRGQRSQSHETDRFEQSVGSDRTAERGRGVKLRDRAGELFSPRGFVLALVLSVVGLVVGGFVPLIGSVTGAIGIALGAFALGAIGEEGRYVEAALAGGVVLGASTFFQYLRFSLFTNAGFAPALLGVGVGLVVSLLGHYFGRDLREGLTQDI